MKSTLAQAGIDTTKFKAHSSRSASSSAAYEAGVALPDIMEAADWSTVSTFTNFIVSQCAKAVLHKQFWVQLNRGHWQFLVKSREALDSAYKGEIQR